VPHPGIANFGVTIAVAPWEWICKVSFYNQKFAFRKDLGFLQPGMHHQILKKIEEIEKRKMIKFKFRISHQTSG
jgi:hypothetical protein